MTILQTPRGFFLCTDENFDPKSGTEFSFDRAMPAISLEKDYNSSSVNVGKSVLERVEAFFKEPLPETS